MSAFGVRDLLGAAGYPGRSGAFASEPDRAAPAHPPAEVLAPRPKASVLSPVVLAGSVRSLETLALALLGLGMHQVRLAGLVPLNLTYLAAILGIVGLAAGFFQFGGTYRIGAFRNVPKTMAKLAAGWTFSFLIVATAMVLAKLADHYSRIWLGSFYLGGLAFLLSGRFALFLFVRAQMRRGLFDRRTAIVGGGPAGEDLIRSLEASNDGSIRIVGVFDDRNADRSSDVVAGVPKLGTVDDLVGYARAARIDLIVFTIPISAEARILQMLAKLWVLPIDIRLSAHATKLRLRPRAYSYLGAVPVLETRRSPTGTSSSRRRSIARWRSSPSSCCRRSCSPWRWR